jgi:2-dehydro-3-deoxygluconokinase
MNTPQEPLLSPRNDANPVRFASIGECMVEMAPAHEAGTFRMGFAGDTFNTAWYMRQLRPDWSTRFVSRVGTDAMSQSMLNMIQSAQIDTTHIGRSKKHSVGLYLISLNDGERSFSYWRDTSAAKQLARHQDALLAATQDADLIYVTGITLAILDRVGREVLLEVLKDARRDGRTIAFDSNLRPGLWQSTSEMCEVVNQAASSCDIVLPSFDDEALHFGDATPQATIERYMERGATSVIVKNGGGAIHYFLNGEEGAYQPSKVTQIVDTTSAGDSFNAGIFAGLDRIQSVERLLLSASKISAKVIGKKGALVPLDILDPPCGSPPPQ